MRTLSLLVLSALFILPLFADQKTVDSDPQADFSKYHTFAIRNGKITSKRPELNSTIIQKQIENDIRSQIRSKGFIEQEQRPDLIVNFHFGSANKREVETWPAGRFGWGRRRVVNLRTEGTLVVDLLDRDSRELVWRGIYVDDESNPSKLAKKLDDDVKKLFDKFPPGKKK